MKKFEEHHQIILDYLTGKEPQTREQIVNGTGILNSTVDSALSYLKEDSKVLKRDKKYRLANTYRTSVWLKNNWGISKTKDKYGERSFR